jgi:EAL domain-containing protein (putative c-di-GMP-specific phosphodiesterase class I)
VTIAIDDFGTGYSSLDTLKSFPFDKLKIDRSFITEIETSREARALLRAILLLAATLRISVLAEGIETEGQLKLLKTKGCREGQGFFLGRPAPLDQLVTEGRMKLRAAIDAATDDAASVVQAA